MWQLLPLALSLRPTIQNLKQNTGSWGDVTPTLKREVIIKCQKLIIKKRETCYSRLANVI